MRPANTACYARNVKGDVQFVLHSILESMRRLDLSPSCHQLVSIAP